MNTESNKMTEKDFFIDLNKSIFWEPIKIEQDTAWITHIPFAHWIVSTTKPNILVELGTHTGVSYSAFCNAVKKNGYATKCYAIDTWQGDAQAGFYSNNIYQKLKAFNNEHFVEFSKLIQSTFDDALALFEDRSIDLLHIDGFHSYEAVSHDFNTWLPKLSNKAIVLFHDIAEHSEGFGVWKFWEEISSQYPNFQFFHGHGLGVLKVGNDTPASLDFLFQMEEAQVPFIRNIFSSLGERWDEERLSSRKLLEAELAQNKIKEDHSKEFSKLSKLNANRLKIIEKEFEYQNADKEASILKYQTKIDSLEQNLNLINLQVRSLETDSLWRYLRKHPKLKRGLTKYIGYIRAFLKKKSKIEVRRFKNAKKYSNVVDNSPLFDKTWYSQKYFDVIYSGFTPAEHYILFGIDGRLPSPHFNAVQYLKDYPDSIISGQPPLLHYELNKSILDLSFTSCPNIDEIDIQLNPAANINLHLDKAKWYNHWQNGVEVSHRKKLGLLNREVNSYDINQRAELFSIIIIVKEVNSQLKASMDSVLNQTYLNWQLYIINVSGDVHINILDSINLDDRIKIIEDRDSKTNPERYNSILNEIQNGYVLFLEKDGLLAPTALQEAAILISDNKDIRMVYADDDTIDSKGLRIAPYFKPDFSLDLLFSKNYIQGFVVYERKLIEEVGRFRNGFGEFYEYDLQLRIARSQNPFKIIGHITWILYHYPTGQNNIMLEENINDQILALEDYFKYEKHTPKIDISNNNSYRINWPISSNQPLVSLIIPTKNGLQDLKTCVDSIIKKTTYHNYEIIVMDNQSTDEDILKYFDFLRNNSNIKVIPYNNKFNYSAINNLAVANSKGELIGLLNNDTEVVNGDWLSEMVSQALRPDIGCVGAKLLYPDGTIQHGGVILGVGDVAGHAHRFFDGDSDGYFNLLNMVHNVSAVTGAVLIVRKEIFLEVDGLDEEYLTVAYNDVDFCLKVREAGYRNLWTPFAVLIHHESKSRGLDNTPEKKLRYENEVKTMKNRWGKKVEIDPYYSPHLTIKEEDFSLRVNL